MAQYKEKIEALLNTNKDSSLTLDFIEMNVKDIIEYPSFVAYAEVRMQRVSVEGLRGEDYREVVSELDTLRKSKHDVAIGAINQFNRLSESSGLAPFYEGDMSRWAIGDLCGDITMEYFGERSGRGVSVARIERNGHIELDDE